MIRNNIHDGGSDITSRTHVFGTRSRHILYVMLGVLSRCYKNNPDQHTALYFTMKIGPQGFQTRSPSFYVMLGVLSRCHKNNPDQHTTLLYLVFRDFNTQSVILYVMLGVISMCQKNH